MQLFGSRAVECVVQTITDHVGMTSEAFSGVATIHVTKTGKYCVLLSTLLLNSAHSLTSV